MWCNMMLISVIHSCDTQFKFWNTWTCIYQLLCINWVRFVLGNQAPLLIRLSLSQPLCNSFFTSKPFKICFYHMVLLKENQSVFLFEFLVYQLNSTYNMIAHMQYFGMKCIILYKVHIIFFRHFLLDSIASPLWAAIPCQF